MRDLEEAKKKLAQAMAKLKKIQQMFEALLRRCVDLYGEVRQFFGSFSFSVSLNFSWGGIPKPVRWAAARRCSGWAGSTPARTSRTR